MNSAIELLNYFVEKSKEINEAISSLADFKFDYSISAAKDNNTIGLHKIEDLNEIFGFFTATSVFESDLITFSVDYGGVEYSLHSYIKIKGKRYYYSSYQQAVLGQTSVPIPNVRSKSQLDEQAKLFTAFLLESYPVFAKNPSKYTRSIAKLSKKIQNKEQSELFKLEAQAAIRKANIYFLDKEYRNAYKLYRRNKAYLSDSDKQNMKQSRKFKRFSL